MNTDKKSVGLIFKYLRHCWTNHCAQIYVRLLKRQ